VFNSSLLLFAAVGAVLAGLAGLDASVIGLRGWVRLPLTNLDVHPALVALMAVLLLAVTLPLIGLQFGREVASRGRAAALLVAGSADQIADLDSPATQVEASEPATLRGARAARPRSKEAVAADRGRRHRVAHRRRIGAPSLG
jgi:hypothetical protein